VTIRHESLCI